jgi:hypothetical protein
MGGKHSKLRVSPSIMPDGRKPTYEWVCKRCGLKRSNQQTHKHGLEMGEPIHPNGLN